MGGLLFNKLYLLVLISMGFSKDYRFAPSLFRQSKKFGKGKIRQGKSEISSFTVSARLIADDEIDLGQVYKDYRPFSLFQLPIDTADVVSQFEFFKDQSKEAQPKKAKRARRFVVTRNFFRNDILLSRPFVMTLM